MRKKPKRDLRRPIIKNTYRIIFSEGAVSLMVPNAEKRIVKEVIKWQGVVANPHRFGGTEFTFGTRELGHVHGDYQADIAFPKAIRNQLVAEKKAEPHHILPQSGWITFRFRKESDVEHAIDLFKLSYDLAIKKATA
jgi:Family of unknown function (DUF5519)